MSLVWINGILTDKADAKVSLFDHGLLYGDGVWEPLRVFGGTLFRPAAHVAALFASARTLAIDIPLSPAELTEAVESTVRANHRSEGYIRVIVTRGPGTIGPDPRKIAPQVFITAEEYLPFPTELYGHGLHVATAPIRLNRNNPMHTARVLGQPHIVAAKRYALENGCLEAVLLDSSDRIIGGTEGGLFLVRGGKVHPVLPHPADAAWDAAREQVGNTLTEEAAPEYHLEDMQTADEVFLVGTSCGVIGIARIDGQAIGSGTEGPITQRIRQTFHPITRGGE